MKVFVIVGENDVLNNISAGAAFTTKEEAERYVADPKRNWFYSRTAIVELELDKEVVYGCNAQPGSKPEQKGIKTCCTTSF